MNDNSLETKINELSSNDDNFFRDWEDDVPPTFDVNKTKDTFKNFANWIITNVKTLDSNV